MPAHHRTTPDNRLIGALPPQPQIADVEQELTSPAALPVKHDGPITSWALPCPTVSPRSYAVGTDVPLGLVRPDPRRASVTLMVTTGTLALSTSYGGAISADAALWPQGVPLVLRTSDELWGIGSGGAATVTVIEEFWAQ